MANCMGSTLLNGTKVQFKKKEQESQERMLEANVARD